MPRHKVERSKALPLLRMLGLKVGDVVNSTAWVLPRIIREISDAGVVVLAEVRGDGTIKTDLVMGSLPLDVHWYDHPARRS